jgi:hypothetical protein
MWGCADALYAKAGMFMYGLCVFLSLVQASVTQGCVCTLPLHPIHQLADMHGRLCVMCRDVSAVGRRYYA